MTTPVLVRPRFSLAGLHPIVLVVPIALIQLGFLFGPANEFGESHPVTAPTVVIVLLNAGVLVARRRYPVETLAAVYLLTSVYFALQNPFGPVFLCLVVALFNAGTLGRRLPAWITCYAGAAVMATAMILSRDDFELGLVGAGTVTAWITLVMAVGELRKSRREKAVQAEQTREEHARRQASEERLRIAREVHDVLAHHVSLINVQSGVALHLIDEQPEQARQALSAIKQSSKEVLVELRNILGVLRDVDRDESSPPRHPVASLDQLDRLLERMREAGLPVRLDVRGDARPIPSGVDAAALRIVQESLTNTYRHAGPTSATVTLRYEPGELHIQVDDDGRGDAGAISGEGTGSGLAGMRQRAEALAGTLTAGPRPNGGFRVTATLPTGTEEAGDET